MRAIIYPILTAPPYLPAAPAPTSFAWYVAPSQPAARHLDAAAKRRRLLALTNARSVGPTFLDYLAPIVRTVKANGTGDFLTLAAWETFRRAQSRADIWAEVWPNLGLTGNLDMELGPETSPTAYPRVYVRDVDRPGNDPFGGSTPIIASGSSANGIRVRVPNARFEGLRVVHTDGATGILVEADNVTIDAMAFNSGSAVSVPGVCVRGMFNDQSATLTIRNCIMSGDGTIDILAAPIDVNLTVVDSTPYVVTVNIHNNTIDGKADTSDAVFNYAFKFTVTDDSEPEGAMLGAGMLGAVTAVIAPIVLNNVVVGTNSGIAVAGFTSSATIRNNVTDLISPAFPATNGNLNGVVRADLFRVTSPVSYHLKYHSPAVGTGETIAGFAADIQAAPRPTVQNTQTGAAATPNFWDRGALQSPYVWHAGLDAWYFNNTNYSGAPAAREYVGAVNHAAADPFPDLPGVNTDDFSVAFVGWIIPKYTQTYTFYLTSAGGAALQIPSPWPLPIGPSGGSIILDVTDHASHEVSATIAMTANQRYPIQVNFYDFPSRSPSIKLEWQSASQGREVVPADRLSWWDGTNRVNAFRLRNEYDVRGDDMLDMRQGEPTAARRRISFRLVGVDGVTPATGEAGGQPEVSADGGTWTGSSYIGTLTHVGNGEYYADLTTTAAALSIDTKLRTRFKSASTAECWGETARIVGYLDSDLGIYATVATTGSSTSFTGSSGLIATDDVYNAKILVWLTGANRGLSAPIDDYTSGRVISFAAGNAWPGTIVTGDRFMIISD